MNMTIFMRYVSRRDRHTEKNEFINTFINKFESFNKCTLNATHFVFDTDHVIVDFSNI